MKKIVAALLTGFVALATAASADVPIARNGQAEAVIVHSGHGSAPQEFLVSYEYGRKAKVPVPTPVEDLQGYLKKITGADIEMVASLAEAGTRPAIVLEVVKKLPGASDTATGAQAYRIRTEGNRIYLAAANELGLSLAIYGLLEDHLGCHFYTTAIKRGKQGSASYEGPGFEVVPSRPTLEIPAINELKEPSFANRGIIFKMGTFPWLVKNRAVGAYASAPSAALNAGHNLYQLLPPFDGKRGKEEIKGLFAEHPEIYPMTPDGRREPDLHNMTLDGTAETLPPLLAKAIIGNKPPSFNDFEMAGQGDGFSRCYSPATRKLVQEQQSEAAPLILALNRALEIVGKTHPDLKVITFSYFGTLDAPKDLKPHSNLWINVVSSSTSLNAAGDQMGPIEGNPANREYARALREWVKLADGRVTVWHWDTYNTEWPSMFYVGPNMRFMHEAGVFGVNPQTCGGPWSDLLNWLYVKLSWDANADADALIRQYLEDVYGKDAAPHLWNYLKTGQKAYEDALHVPSAVRWSGWTKILMQKIFHEGVRPRLREFMDKAEAAVRKSGTPEQLTHLLEARDESLDALERVAAMELGGKRWGFVSNKADGRDWYVAGADPDLPALLQRGKNLRKNSPVGLASFAREAGGPVVDLVNKSAKVRVVPEIAGSVVGITDGATGKELLATGTSDGGYTDDFPLMKRFHRQVWVPAGDHESLDPATLWSEYKPPNPAQLETTADFGDGNVLARSVAATPAGAVKIARSYSGKLTPQIDRFNTRWRLALPAPEKSTVRVEGGGVKQFMDLRYAEPGGIRFVKAGQRPPGYEGLDAMSAEWDAVSAVSDAQVSDFEVTDKKGEVHIELDRGDGIAVMITTPAAGWKSVQVRPMVGEHTLEIVLVGEAPEAGEAPMLNVVLPEQILAARKVAEGKAADIPKGAGDVAKANIRITGENRAINDADGAELIWIPAGTFRRGSEVKPAGSDEGPARDIYLDGYWIYKLPVTVASYRKFCEATGREIPQTWSQKPHWRADPSAPGDNFPMICNWFEADAYAKWAGGSLPTEAQWEKAARGTDGREYPWGNQWDPKRLSCMANTIDQFVGPFRPVGYFPEGASPYGVLDMAGNVWEWVNDWYMHTYYASAPDRNPTGPDYSNVKVVRGGNSLFDERFSRTTARMAIPPEVSDWTAIGFRLVVEAPGPGTNGP